jgi:hypothetical protein
MPTVSKVKLPEYIDITRYCFVAVPALPRSGVSQCTAYVEGNPGGTFSHVSNAFIMAVVDE